MKTKRLAACLLCAVLTAANVNLSTFAASETNAEVNIDVSDSRGSFVRMEQYGNYTGSPQSQNAAVRVTDMKFMQKNGLNGKMMRMWVSLGGDFTYLNSSGKTAAKTADIVRAKVNSTAAAHFADISRYTDELLVCVQHTNMLTGTWSQNDLIVRYTAAIKALVTAFPKAKLFEVVNEPDLADGSFYSSVDDYYDCYYKAPYKALKAVNDALGLTGENSLKLGGPVTAMFIPTNRNSAGQKNTYYIRDFIRRYKTDADPDKRLDFISYHQYGSVYKGDVAFMGTEQAQLRSWLGESYGGVTLDENMPVYVSELGVFPGKNSSSLDFYADTFLNAAALASMNYHYINNAGGNLQMHPFMWFPRHTQNTNWRKNILVNDRTDNSSGAVTQYFTPTGNMFRMMAMLRHERVAAEVTPQRSGSAGDGSSLGIYTLATRDDDSVGVMLWNYQFDSNSSLASPFNKGNVTYNVRTNINGLDSIEKFRGKDVLVRLYRTDAESGSYLHRNGSAIDGAATETDSGITIDKELINLDGANTVPYEEYTVTPQGGSISFDFSFDRNKFRFAELIPIASHELARGRRAWSNGGGLSAAYAFDGDMSTRWGAKNNSYPYYIAVDLGRQCRVTSAKINWYKQNERCYGYKIYESDDGASFSLIADRSDNKSFGETEDCFSSCARYYKIEVTGCSNAAGYASINEIELFGSGEIACGADSFSNEITDVQNPRSCFASGGTLASNPARLAFDNDSSTRWIASGLAGQYIGCDLGCEYELDEVTVDWYSSGSRTYQYIVQGSADGETYFTLSDESSNKISGTVTSDVSGKKARFIRIMLTGASNPGYNPRVNEITVTAKQVNHSWEREVTAEQYVNGEWSKTESANSTVSALSKMFDGSASTRWGASTGDFPYRVTVELDEETDISYLDIDWYEGGFKNRRIYSYTVETSTDGENFAAAYDGTQSRDMGSSKCPVNARARYVRINITGVSDGGYASICELRVFGGGSAVICNTPEFTANGRRAFLIAGDGSIGAETLIINNGAEFTAMLVTAAYDSGGNLTAVSQAKQTVEANSRCSIKAEINAGGNAAFARSFLWNGKSMTPLSGVGVTAEYQKG